MKRRGFTLIEMLVVLAILASLAQLALPAAQLVVQRTKEQQLRTALRDIRTALDRYHEASFAGRIKRNVDDSGYPPHLRALVEGVPDQSDPQGKRRLYFLRRIPSDPFATDESTADAQLSWGVRSYASEPDEPRQGDDVYDVYSRSERMGLNGVPYRQW